MKKIHILGLIVIAIAVGVIISTAGDASTYVTFNEAEAMTQKGNHTSIHVVGELTKDEQGNITNMMYRPEIDPNHFEFSLIDNAGTRSEEHTSELQSREKLVCRLLLEKKKENKYIR